MLRVTNHRAQVACFLIAKDGSLFQVTLAFPPGMVPVLRAGGNIFKVSDCGGFLQK